MGKQIQHHAHREAKKDPLAALRRQAIANIVPGSVSAVEDTSLQTLPRILGAEVAYRSRLVEELHLMQSVLTQELFRQVKDRPPASLPALVREIRACITDQLRIVEKAPIGTGADAARSQVRDLLQRHALVAAELRRKGLGQLLDRLRSSEDAELPALLADFTRPTAEAQERRPTPDPTSTPPAAPIVQETRPEGVEGGVERGAADGDKEDARGGGIGTSGP